MSFFWTLNSVPNKEIDRFSLRFSPVNIAFMNIILATKSSYKISLLEKLGYSFIAEDSDFDEKPFKNKGIHPKNLASLLAEAKAKALHQKYPNHCIIGSDQVLALENLILSKPLSEKKNIEQLMSLSGKTHTLFTAVCVLYKNRKISFTNKTDLLMRELTLKQIKDYVQKEKAFDCCGGYKIESYGISLFEKIKTSDFTAIQGLPLIKLNQIISTLDK